LLGFSGNREVEGGAIGSGSGGDDEASWQWVRVVLGGLSVVECSWEWD